MSDLPPPTPSPPTPLAGSPPPQEEEGGEELLSPWTLLGQTLLGIGALVGLMFVLGKVFREELLEGGALFVSTLGGPGIAMCCAGPDALPMPPPHEICMMFGWLGGMTFWEVTLWATLGSVGGGCVGYLIGRTLSQSAWFVRFTRGRARLAWGVMERHGALALALGALSPLPYSVCCWASGAMRMNPAVFLVVSLLRLPRLAFYLWLVMQGLVDIAPR